MKFVTACGPSSSMARKLSVALLLLLSLCLITPLSANAQGVNDMLRLTTDPMPSGGRGSGMAGAMIAAARDYTALDWNPAALAPLEFGELGLTIASRHHGSNASYFGTLANDDAGSTSFGSMGLAFGVPTKRGHLAFGIAYDRVRDYTNIYSFDGVNPSSAFIGTSDFLADPGQGGQSYDSYLKYLDKNHLAWSLYLTNDLDSLNPVLTTPVKGGMRESGTVTEEGGMSAFRLGAGVDIAENLSLGATLNFLGGSYAYFRQITDADTSGLYASAFPKPGFQYATISDKIEQDQKGMNIKLGLLAYPSDLFRFGLTVESPTVFWISESSVRSGRVVFDGVESKSELSAEPLYVQDYTITTPFKFGGGVSSSFLGATLAASFTYMDMSQARIKGDDIDEDASYLAGLKNLKSVFSWRLGAEYIIAPLGVGVRAGYSIEPSARDLDVDENNIQTISTGLSILLSKSVMLESAVRFTSFKTYHTLYSAQIAPGEYRNVGVTADQVQRTDVAISLGYRF